MAHRSTVGDLNSSGTMGCPAEEFREKELLALILDYSLNYCGEERAVWDELVKAEGGEIQNVHSVIQN